MDKKIDVIVNSFMDHLDSDKIFDLNIIKNVEEDFYDFYDRIDEITANDTTARKLFEPETSKSYAQLFSVLCFMRDLSRSKFRFVKKTNTCTELYFVLQSTANRTVSLRDVYYSLKNIFSTQSECNGAVLDVGRNLQMKRRAFVKYFLVFY
jgi:DNA topoisomerase VI subunit A